MSLLIAYFCVHMVLVATTKPLQNLRSMILSGRYRLGPHDGVGA